MSSPIARTVRKAHDAVEGAQGPPPNLEPDTRPGDFIRRHFISHTALASALQHDLVAFIVDEQVAAHLGDDLVQRLLGERQINSWTAAQSVCDLLVQPNRFMLQVAVLKFVEARNEMRFCLKPTRGPNLARQNPLPIVPPSFSFCHGREAELDQIVRLLSDTSKNSAIAICGAGGIGKTTLAQIAVNGVPADRLRRDRGFWINCEGDQASVTFLQHVVRTLSDYHTLTDIPTEDAEATFFSYLDRLSDARGPAIVVFDNLETIFDVDAELVECVLGTLLCRVSVVITMRGPRAPSIGRMWDWLPAEAGELLPLPHDAWMPAFEQHAGRGMTDAEKEALSGVLSRIGGYPLALSLLGKSLARGAFTAETLCDAWIHEISRTAGMDDTRLTCLDASIQVSLASPPVRNTSFGKDLLYLTAHLPSESARYLIRPGESPRRSSQGLPKWFAKLICGTNDQTMASWSALLQSGLAYEASDTLQLLPPIREVLQSHQPSLHISAILLQEVETWLEVAWLQMPHFAVKSVSRCHGDLRLSWFEPVGSACAEVTSDELTLQFLSETGFQPTEPAADALYLRVLGLLYRHAAVLQNSDDLFDFAKSLLAESARQLIQCVNQDTHCGVSVGRAWLSNTSALQAYCSYEGSYSTAIHFFEQEADAWQLANRPSSSDLALAWAMCLRREEAALKGLTEEALRFASREADYWRRAGRHGDHAAPFAELVHIRVSLWSLENRYGTDRDALVGLWGNGSPGMREHVAKLESLLFLAEDAEASGRLEEALDAYMKEACVWDLIPLTYADNYARGARTLAAICGEASCENAGDLVGAGCHRNSHFGLWLRGDGYGYRHRPARAVEVESDGNEALPIAIIISQLYQGFATDCMGLAGCRTRLFGTRSEVACNEGRFGDAARFREVEGMYWDIASRRAPDSDLSHADEELRDYAVEARSAASKLRSLHKRQVCRRRRGRLWLMRRQLRELGETSGGYSRVSQVPKRLLAQADCIERLHRVRSLISGDNGGTWTTLLAILLAFVEAFLRFA